ncbi:MAG: LPXTG cell wall anchor domain-containing protein [Arcanobacterium sp.]|nr:LPXTG cell wall anchor domain-containing protein [Arcanobacterium sp.]
MKRLSVLLAILLAASFTTAISANAAEEETYQAFSSYGGHYRELVDSSGRVDANWSLCVNSNMTSPGSGDTGTGEYQKIYPFTSEDYDILVTDPRDGSGNKTPNFQKAKRLLYFAAENEERLKQYYNVFQNEFYHLNGVKGKDTNYANFPVLNAFQLELRERIESPVFDTEIDQKLDITGYKNLSKRPKAEQNLITATLKAEPKTPPAEPPTPPTDTPETPAEPPTPPTAEPKKPGSLAHTGSTASTLLAGAGILVSIGVLINRRKYRDDANNRD